MRALPLLALVVVVACAAATPSLEDDLDGAGVRQALDSLRGTALPDEQLGDR